MKKLMLVILLSFATLPSLSFGSQNMCSRYTDDSVMDTLLRELATKLVYDYEQLCSHPRILDIYKEERRVYHRDTDAYHQHIFITLHYNEYSCEYQYDVDSQNWAEQYCYSTF